MAITLLESHNSEHIIELFNKDQSELIQLIREAMDTHQKRSPAQGLHSIALVRMLLVFCGGPEDPIQLRLDHSRSSGDNHNFYGSLVGVSGSRHSESFDFQSVQNDMLKAVADKTVNFDTLSTRLVAKLPIDFPPNYLVGRVPRNPLSI